jgi:hypothetical protein
MSGWRKVRLLGLDIGYAKTRKTTGVAIYRDGALRELCCVGSSREDRRAVIERHAPFDAIAIDGPLLPSQAPFTAPRLSEYLLSGADFARRCKPGLSHFGQGLELRRAAMHAAQDDYNGSSTNTHIVEAFPTGFLGVMIDDGAYDRLGKLARGTKSDVFYRHAAKTSRFDAILDLLQWRDDALLGRFAREAASKTRASHEYRAALICLLTAACAWRGACEHVGDAATGAIALPPLRLWAPWAIKALAERRQAMTAHSHFQSATSIDRRKAPAH